VSYDLVVMDADEPMTLAQVHERLDQGEAASSLTAAPAPRLTSFITELSRKYPSIDDVPERDLDRSPWANGFDVEGDLVWLNVSWSRAQEVARHVAKVAEQTGVVIYDPQEDRVILPTRLGGDGNPRFDVHNPVPDFIASLNRDADQARPMSFLEWLRSFFFGPKG
jgi:hypothetical protein